MIGKRESGEVVSIFVRLCILIHDQQLKAQPIKYSSTYVIIAWLWLKRSGGNPTARDISGIHLVTFELFENLILVQFGEGRDVSFLEIVERVPVFESGVGAVKYGDLSRHTGWKKG